MEHRITITNSKVVCVYRDKDIDAMNLHIAGLIADKIAFSYEYA